MVRWVATPKASKVSSRGHSPPESKASTNKLFANPDGVERLSGPYRAETDFSLPLFPWVAPTASHGLPFQGNSRRARRLTDHATAGETPALRPDKMLPTPKESGS
jgi:hypothetical protein